MVDKFLSILGGNLFSGVGELVGKFIEDPTKRAELAAQLQQLEAQKLLKLEELAYQDRDSARKREAAVTQVWTTTSILAYAYTLGYFAALWFVATHSIADAQIRIFDVLLGTLTAAQLGIIGYYFGSSHSSQTKTAILDRVVNHKE